MTSAYPPERGDLERASALARSFREQPTPELARSVQRGVASAISANERMQYAAAPLGQLRSCCPCSRSPTPACTSPAACSKGPSNRRSSSASCVGYAVGKPIGIMLGNWVATRPALHGPRPLISGPILFAAGTCAGIGFTVSLLISSLAFTGVDARRGQARRAVHAGARAAADVVCPVRSSNGFRREVRARQIRGTAEDIPDLTDDVDPERDHIRGPADAPVTLLEYGDFECPYCGQAEQTIRELLMAQGTDVRYVWRHLPLNDVHPFAQTGRRSVRGGRRPGELLGHVRHAARPPGGAPLERPDALRRGARPRRRAASRPNCATASTPTASSRTSPAPTRAASPARPRSSSTAAATTACMTCRR